MSNLCIKKSSDNNLVGMTCHYDDKETIFKAHACGKSYRFFLNILLNKRCFDEEYISTIEKSVERLRLPLELVTDLNEQIIIEKEILGGKTGKWYLEYFSESTYRRYLPKACRNYIQYVEFH